MNLQTIPADAPGTGLFPEYDDLYELITREVTGLTAALTYPSLCHKTGSLLCGRSGQTNASW